MFKQRIAAGAEAVPVAKTCSDGTVLIERGRERIEVGFHVTLRKETAEEYQITFHNLPNWAAPISFSFVGPDNSGTMKEYELRSEFREGWLYFKVENEEQEDAFLDKEEVYIGFIISEATEE